MTAAVSAAVIATAASCAAARCAPDDADWEEAEEAEEAEEGEEGEVEEHAEGIVYEYDPQSVAQAVKLWDVMPPNTKKAWDKFKRQFKASLKH